MIPTDCHAPYDRGIQAVGATMAAPNERFERAEFSRRAKTHPVELIGPINGQVILGGVGPRSASDSSWKSSTTAACKHF